MRTRDAHHLRDLVRQINDPRAALTRSDAVAFLILLRDSAPRNSMLRDLGHSVAHDTRDRGLSFDYLEKFSLNVRRVLIHGGILNSKTMFPINDVIGEVNLVLANLHIADRLIENDDRVRFLLTAMIGQVLDGTTYHLRVAEGKLSVDRFDTGLPSFSASFRYLHDIDGVIQLRASERKSLGFGWMLDTNEVERILSPVSPDGSTTNSPSPGPEAR